MRAPGEAIGTFAIECAVDELAHDMSIDPIELRRRNEPDRHPIHGTPFSQRALMKAYADGAKRFGWERRLAEPGARREGEWSIGLGCASGRFPYSRMPSATVPLTRGTKGQGARSASAHGEG